MRVSRSNHAVYLRWHTTPLRDTRKDDDRAHIPRAKFASRSPSIVIYSFETLLLEYQVWTLNAAFCHVTLPYTRTEGISAWELPSRYCSQYTFFWIAVRNYSTSECELPIHASYRTHQLSDYRASLTARFKQILIRLNNKFRIVTTKRVVVITRRLGKQAFHTRW